MSLFDDKEAFKDIAHRAIELAVQDTVRKIIENHAGSGIDSEIKQAIREEAKNIVTSDPEVKAMIRSQIIHWIKKQ